MTLDSQTGWTLPRWPSPTVGHPLAQALPKKLEMSVVVLEGGAGLEAYLPAWEDLAQSALEPNAFYEPWMLRPALQHLAEDQDLLVVLVVAQPPAGSGQAPLLCGLFPLRRHRRTKGLPVARLELWRYLHCYLCTPLVRAACAEMALASFLDWLAKDGKSAPLMEWGWVAGEGPFHRLLLELLALRRVPLLLEESYARALLCPRASAQEYLEEALSGERRRKLRRNEKSLMEKGTVQYVRLEAESELEGWLESFLRLEAAGWKGKEGTALQCTESDRRFFLQAMAEAFRRGRLLMMALQLDGRPIAFTSDLLAGEWSYIFKITFDEDYKAFAPGLLLEVEKIRRIHDMPGIAWVDSCNKPGPSVLKELLPERRLMQTFLTAPGRAPGQLALALVPLLRWLRRKTCRAPRTFQTHRT